jgi:hypothetical protein
MYSTYLNYSIATREITVASTVTVRAYVNNLGARLGEVRRDKVDRGSRSRFGSSEAWFQLIGCALHYVRPRDFEVRTRGKI